MTTPILQTLLPLVTDYGTRKAVEWLEGNEELAKPDDDLTSFLSRHDIEWDQLEADAQDHIRDAYLESVKSEMGRRLAAGKRGTFIYCPNCGACIYCPNCAVLAGVSHSSPPASQS